MFNIYDGKEKLVMKNKVMLTNDTALAAEGFCDVSIKRRDDGHSLIKDAFYILRIKCNILSIR